MESRLDSIILSLRIAFGLTAFLAGLDKFLNLLTNWEQYASPLALDLLPLSAGALMRVAGVIEMIAGIAVLSGLTRLGGYVIAGWLTASRSAWYSAAASSTLPCATSSWRSAHSPWRGSPNARATSTQAVPSLRTHAA